MENITIKTLVVICFLALTGCSTTKDDVEKVPERSAQTLFDEAREALDKGLYQNAIAILSAIDKRFPFGPISHQVQLDLIYAYYKSGNIEEGIALAERFLKLNPDHPNIDYAYYLKGLMKFSEGENLFQKFVGIDRSDRDPKPSMEAFESFKTIITEFPDSKYAGDARQRMVAIKSRLAKYELKVAEYYMKREAWISAANRGRYVVEYFSSTAEMEQALEIMIECYDQLKLDDLKKNALQVLAANFPNNSLVK